MKQVLFLGGIYLTCTADDLWFGGDNHDYNQHGEATENEDSTADNDFETVESILGNVVDEFGCLTDAGYTWCEKLTKCLQLFEEACEEEETVMIDGTEVRADLLDSLLPSILRPVDHIPNLAVEEEEGSLLGGDEDYMPHRETNVMLGGERDENGCLGSGGYQWCEKQNNCVRSWELEGEWEDECVAETSYSSDSSVSDSSVESNEEGSGMLGGVRDEDGCLGSAGYKWCEKQNNCVRSWELEGEWDDECVAETTTSSYDDVTKFFFNEDGTIKPWVFRCFLVLAVIATLLLICLIRARRIRKRRQRRRSAGVMLAGNRDNYARFNADGNNTVFQETVAVRDATKDAVPSRKEFINLV